MTLRQFTQPIHDTPIGEVIVLPPCICKQWGVTSSSMPCCCQQPAAGDKAEVVERWPDCPDDCPVVHVWRRVAFVRVVEVLQIVHGRGPGWPEFNGLPDRLYVVWPPETPGLKGQRLLMVRHVAPDGSRWWRRHPADIDLPTAEPGGLVVMVERIDCPTCGGRGTLEADEYEAPAVAPCPTCTTPPEVTM